MSKPVRGDEAVDNEAKELIARINKFCAGDLGHRNMDNLSYPILKEFCYSLDVAKANAEYSAKTKLSLCFLLLKMRQKRQKKQNIERRSQDDMEQKLGSVKGQLAVVKRQIKTKKSSPKNNSRGVRPFRV